MVQKELSQPNKKRFWGYLIAGIAAGYGAGFLTAYLETMFLLFTVGPFWVDFSFLWQALLLYGLIAGVCGGGFSLLLYFAFFSRHPLRNTRPWLFFFAWLSACGLGLEVLLYLLDIHTFRDLSGGWTTLAYGLLFLASLLTVIFGWMINVICRKLFLGSIRKCLLNGGLAVLLFIFVFLFARGFVVQSERSGLATPPGKGAPNPANIIILLLDTLRPDHLSVYGYPLPTSPAIDRLARAGVLFRNCYATSTWTVPTHASIFTGLYPSSHGGFSLYSALDSSMPTLAQILAGRGYRTASFFDNPMLGPRYGLLRGFRTALGVDNEHKVSLAFWRVWERLRGNRSMSKTILQVAGKWIEYVPPRERPFFLFINFLDVHVPYRPQKPYIDDFLRSLPDKNINSKLAGKFTTGEIITKKAAHDLGSRMTAADWRWLERFYDSNIRALDDRINGFLERLKAGGFLKNTLVIITSDHGELFGEGGIGGHLHSSMHNAGLRIPLVFWFPERLAPQQVDRLVSQVDIFPTVLALAGFSAAIPGNVQGLNLFSAPRDRELLVEFWDDIRKRFSRAFVAGDFKLVITAAAKEELYDLKNDAAEKTDLALLQPELLRTLAFRLNKLLQSLPQRKSSEEAGKKKELEKLLKSLGYL